MVRFQRATTSLGVALLLLLLGGSPILAQSLSSGSIEGVVTREDGTPVAARLTLHAAGVLQESASSGHDGTFSFGSLPAGSYTLRAEQFGFRPVLVTGIAVRPGEVVQLRMTLESVPGVAEAVDTVVFRGSLLGGTGPRSADVIPPGRLHALPAWTRDLAEIGRFSSVADADGAMQGLPAAFSGFQVNGSRVYTLASAALVPGSYRSAELPVGLFDQAAVVGTNPDVEWSFTGGALEGYTRQPPRRAGVTAYGDWAGSSLSSGYSGPDAGSFQSVRGGFTLGLPIVPDTAGLLIGVDVRHLATPTLRPWPQGDSAAAVLAVARDSFGVDLGSPQARLRESDLVSAFGLLGWQLSSASHLALRVNAAVIPEGDGGVRLPPDRGELLPFEGRDFSTSLLLSTRLGTSASQELRAGWDHNSRDYGSAGTLGLAGRTDVVAGGVGLSSHAALPASFRQSTVHASETLLFNRSAHRMKVGISTAWRSILAEPTSYGEFLFSDVDAFAAGAGYARIVRPGALAGTQFNLLSGALYAQDSWNAAPGLQLLFGLRLDAERLPTGKAQPDTLWRALTGLDNTQVHSAWVRLNPRFGLSWSPAADQSWMVAGSAGLYTGSSDALLLSTWVDGPAAGTVRQGFGALQGWPQLPDTAALASAGRMLLLLDPDYAPPRTLRATLGITRALGSSGSIRLEGLYRHTDVLPRLTDLNVLSSPVARDYGTVEQHGAIITAAPGSNRRFASFDRVLAANLDGWSTYWGATVRVEERAAPGVDLFGSYTYSMTRDNWVANSGLGLEPSVVPAPAGAEADWMTGTSGFDVPHRLVLGTTLSSERLGGLQLSALYRYRSGIPFTPTLGPGVEVGGAGVPGSAPAFVDASAPGMETLLSRWSCLESQAGRFAERNSCRSDGLQSLDARLSIPLIHSGRFSGHLVLDGLGLLASEVQLPDPVLYRVDPSGAIAVDDASGVVTLPLAVNPGFGEPTRSLGAGRILRIGLQLNF